MRNPVFDENNHTKGKVSWDKNVLCLSTYVVVAEALSLLKFQLSDKSFYVISFTYCHHLSVQVLWDGTCLLFIIYNVYDTELVSIV